MQANAMSQCEAFGLQPPEAAAEVIAVIAIVNDWQQRFALAGGGSERGHKSLAERTDGPELLGQRNTFDPGAFQSAPCRQKNLGPFRRS